MQKIKASIVNRGERKYWYVKYQVFFENDTVKTSAVSTRILKTEESLEYMQYIYLPAWIARKEDELKNLRDHSTKFVYYASLYLETCKDYRDYYNVGKRVNRIIADFGADNIGTIKKLKIKLWVNGLKHFQTKKDLSRATRKKYKSTFNAIFELALDDEVIERNFIYEIKVLGIDRDKNDIKPFSVDEVKILLRASKDAKYGKLLHLYLGLVFNQGLSPSEALGLQTGDIRYDSDLGKNILSIQRGITKNKEGDTKNTYRKREIVLRDEAREYTDKLMFLARKKLTIWLFSDDGGMRLKDIEDIRGTKAYFSTEKNKYEHHSTKWYKLLSDCNMEHRHIKNCRHTFTMAMLDANIYSHTALADMLGHSDLQMIIKHYANSIKGKALEVKSEGNLYDGATLGATSENRVNMSSLKIV